MVICKVLQLAKCIRTDMDVPIKNLVWKQQLCGSSFISHAQVHVLNDDFARSAWSAGYVVVCPRFYTDTYGNPLSEICESPQLWASLILSSKPNVMSKLL